MNRDSGQVLIPPGVTPDVAQRTFIADVASTSGRCPPATEVIALKLRRHRARVTVTRDNLAKQPRGWLRQWAYQLEEQGCVAPGEGMKLARRVAESVPLEPSAAFNLLYSDDRQTGVVDVDPQTRLQVVSPLLREPGLGLMADGPYKIEAGRAYNLNITGKSTENVLGYETAIYAVQPTTPIGSTIVPLYADRNIQGKVERTPQPAINHFRFPTNAAFYQIIYKSWQTDFTALMIAARTPAELDQHTRKPEAKGTSLSCGQPSDGLCIEIPRVVAVHPLISVTVNGAELLIPRGATIFQAIRRSGEQKPDNVLPHLSVYKPWEGQLMRVAFDAANGAILKLILRGGETISWRRASP